jgi:ribosomal protection tetracycline resistance protein
MQTTDSDMSSTIPHYIIDGYNLLHAIPQLKRTLGKDPEGAREQLIHLVARQTTRRKFRCTIIFDGVRPDHPHAPAPHSPLHIVFSSPQSADGYIRSMIEKSKQRTNLVVISSDHEILNHARACMCTTHTSKYFSVQLTQDDTAGEEKEQTALSKTEVETWLKIFSRDREE